MVTAQTRQDGQSVTVTIAGRFDFKVHKEFREAYKHTPRTTEFVVDMARTEYMDSSALGMLLLLREHLGGDSAKIRIVHCKPDIKKVLSIANFHKLFMLAA